MGYEEIWQSVLGELELSISKASFTTWFKNTYIIKIENQTVTIAVPNGFTKRWLENKYNVDILQAINNIHQDKKIDSLIFTISHNKPSEDKIEKISLQDINKKVEEQEKTNSLKTASSEIQYINTPVLVNPRYNFNNFITGKQNELAKAASMAAAKNPGRVYNPLFLYGEVGLGKTHLMQSIANHIKENFPKFKLAYITSEHFTNEYVKSIQSGKIDSFKKKYRELDILLVDDIQFMKGQERTQEEFFHTFNNLYQQNKQIVISSDRPPKSLPAIEQRLTSRFESGMIADIGHPDLETRVAILKSKVQEKNINLNLTEDLITSIANIAKSNVRELEGALNRVIAVHQLSNQEITQESIKESLGNVVLKQKEGALTTKKVIKTVADFFDVAISDLTGNCRKKELVRPRQIAMYLMRTELSRSYPNIGSEIGGRDHTTAIHGFNKIDNEIKINEKLKEDVDLLKQKLSG